ncbi:MAG: mandelate racemase [Rhizobiales bacterium]|nr:mandelate racemase [Hyphomicrobiales bacterium]
MKITRISLYQVDLPMTEGSYSWSTQSFSAFDSTVVRVETDEGIIGYGETCPLGPSYLPAYPEGARVGLAKIAPDMIGQDPTAIERINDRMDLLLKGHPYVKSALDMACWDILGKSTGLPVYTLLGGKRQEKVKLFKVISRADPDLMAARVAEYREKGFRQFQMKVGADPTVDITRFRKVAAQMQPGEVLDADANTGWRQHDAIRVVDAVSPLASQHDIRLYIEQPCLSYEECLAVRRHTNLPMILDECMESLAILLRGYHDQAMDLINLKINRMGGLTRAKLVRDLCQALGIVMTIEDSWGGEIATAAIAHLAHSTLEDFHFQSSAFHEYHTVAIAEGGPTVEGGHMRAGDRPGLGVEPIMKVLGNPVFVT